MKIITHRLLGREDNGAYCRRGSISEKKTHADYINYNNK